MKIETKQKIFLYKINNELSRFLILYSVDGALRSRLAILNNELPDEILQQLCVAADARDIVMARIATNTYRLLGGGMYEAARSAQPPQ